MEGTVVLSAAMTLGSSADMAGDASPAPHTELPAQGEGGETETFVSEARERGA